MAEQRNPEVFSWLKTLPLAPEYHPTIQEFQDPIAYIFKIEKEASTFGICKIVPPLPPQPKRAAITNLNRSLAARNPNSEPTFTTRQQQIGFCPRKQRPIQKSVWQSGERYTPHEFEVKAKGFEKNYVKNGSKKGLSALEVETLYWKANGDRPFSVEYANDMAGSAFGPVKEKGNGGSVGDTAWNMRGVARAKGSLLRFMKEDIPGVTSPMVYIAMMFSWFAWHVEDHDLHSLNYLHMGAGKTWYGVPRDAAMAFEEVIRVHGYGDEINPLVTFATLGEKTTVMSPEVLINAGVPCCRLVQNAGEFVVTFPRAYHSGFSHGYNCGEASNIATPEWLKFAKDAAIRRASINCPPMVSHFQLLYDLALSICSSNPLGGASEPRSSRLKDKKKGEGENLVKQMFVQDVMQNNDLLHALGKGSIVVLLPQSSAEKFVCSNFHIGSKYKVKPRLPFSLSSPEEPGQASEHLSPGQQVKQPKAFYLGKGNFSAVSEGNSSPWIAGNDRTSVLPYGSKNLEASEENAGEHGISESGLFTCVKCGIWTFACVAIVQPTEEASQYLMSADCNFLNDWIVGSGVSSGGMIVSKSEANVSEPDSVSGSAKRNIRDGLYDVPVHSADDEIKIEDISNTEKTFKMTLDTDNKKNPSALGLLAMTYGNSSDSDEDSDSPDDNNRASRDGSWGRFQNHDSVSPTSPQDHNSCVESDLSLSSNDYHGKYARGAKNNDRGREMNSSNVLNAAKTRTNAVIVPVETPNTHFGQRCGHDASRMHIFCLEHALEVDQQLRPIGGVHIFLLCHPDYPKVEAEAKKVSEELDMDYTWKDIAFAEASEEDEERILLALETEEATPKNGDWSVKLGINLFYSAILSRSPLYSKQMPFNSVIYNAFGYSSPSNSPVQEKYRLCVGRQKKLVMAGRWCGKVWMSNQVHPLLVKRDPDYDEERTFNSCLMSNENIERKTEVGVEAQCASTSRKAVSKRKMKGDGRLVKRPKWHDKEIVYAVSEEDSLADDKSQDEPKISERKTKLEHKLIKPRTRRMKEVRESDPDSPNSEPRQAHRRSVRKLKTRMKPSKKGLVQERESVKSDSDDALNNEFRIRNRKNGKKMKKMASREREIIPSDSEGSLDDESEPKRCRLEASWPRAVFQRVRHQFESISRGPSTRLRKRPANHPAEPETKPVSKKHPSKTSRKNAPERTLKHDEEGEFCCDIEGCTMSFGSRQELIVHKRNICPVKGCGKKFFSHKYLVQHRRVHMDDRPLKCPWKGCRMSFKWAWARTEHIRVHTGARPYVCNEPGCGQTFRFVSDFSRHKRKTGHSTKKGKR